MILIEVKADQRTNLSEGAQQWGPQYAHILLQNKLARGAHPLEILKSQYRRYMYLLPT